MNIEQLSDNEDMLDLSIPKASVLCITQWNLNSFTIDFTDQDV